MVRWPRDRNSLLGSRDQKEVLVSLEGVNKEEGEKCGQSVGRGLNIGKHWMISSRKVMRLDSCFIYESFTHNCPKGFSLVWEDRTERR